MNVAPLRGTRTLQFLSSRCDFTAAATAGALGLSLAEILALRAASAESAATFAGSKALPLGRAKSCVVLFAWGGTSHVDTWDMLPLAGAGVRGGKISGRSDKIGSDPASQPSARNICRRRSSARWASIRA